MSDERSTPNLEVMKAFVRRATAFQQEADEQGYGDPARIELRLLRELYDFINNRLGRYDNSYGNKNATEAEKNNAFVPWNDLNLMDEITDRIEEHYAEYGWPPELVDKHEGTLDIE